jgi:NAD(P)-dependent dehydrogenase (short-subunit alcohol dehydrogenase family)
VASADGAGICTISIRMKGKVVVITGASSGLGRASAVELAKRGARVVLAARSAEGLEETAAKCRAAGSEGLIVPTDVTIEGDVMRLAGRALELTGRIDVWVNNAGVTAFGALEDGPFETHRRVIETNLFGAIYGARAVMPVFRRQRAGVLINVGSILSKIGQPFVPSYVISKFGLRGLTETLRTATADDPDIHVCSLLPYAIDTPHFQEGANRTGYAAHAMPPMQSPEKIAKALVGLIQHPRRELHVPRIAAAFLALHAVFPTMTERLLLHLLREWHFGYQRVPNTTGNLYEPTAEAHTHGERPARASLPRLVLWTTGHFLRRAKRRGRDRGDETHLQPHADG